MVKKNNSSKMRQIIVKQHYDLTKLIGMFKKINELKLNAKNYELIGTFNKVGEQSGAIRKKFGYV